MKKSCFLFFLLCAAAFAQGDTVVRWRGIAGIITAPGIDNPVGQIHSGGPWTVQSGNARLNLATGEGDFEVEGLVLVGGNNTGTPGPVANVIGTFVCNPGGAGGGVETVIDTTPTSLSHQGDAELSFRLTVPPTCNNPLFLIRVPGAGRWIATGTQPFTNVRFGN